VSGEVGPCLRQLSSAELEALGEIERAAFSRPWSVESLRAELARPDAAGSTPALRADGVPRRLSRGVWLEADLRAYLIAWVLETEAHVARIATAPPARRRGAARELMRWLLAACPPAGVRHVVLEVREDNAAALALYETLGFARIGTRPGYYVEDGLRTDAAILLLGL